MYIIYRSETGERVDRYKQYKTESAAKAARTRMLKAGKGSIDTDLAIATYDEWEEKENYDVERVNLMSGKKYMEPRFTPVHLSPAFESYWSM